MKNEPTNSQLMYLLLVSFALLSLGAWTIWVPYLGKAIVILAIGIMIMAIAAFLAKMIK
jgi:hypothetical protein